MRMPARLRRRVPGAAEGKNGETFVVELEPGELTGVFAAPAWLRDLGVMSWLLVGVAALLVGTIWLLATVQTIVIPVVTAGILAAVLSPLVGAAARHMPRGAATALVFLAVLVLGIALAVGVLAGITSEAKGLTGDLQGAVDKAQGWLQDAGVSADKAQSAGDDASSTVSSAFHALLTGLGKGVRGLASLAVFLSFTALSLFFLLKDGPVIREWTERHRGSRRPSPAPSRSGPSSRCAATSRVSRPWPRSTRSSSAWGRWCSASRTSARSRWSTSSRPISRTSARGRRARSRSC
jgi:hypothetical protein